MTGKTGVLVMAHGTPARLDDLESFLTTIRRGRAPDKDLIDEMRLRYEAIGGISPHTSISMSQTESLRRELDHRHPGGFEAAYGARFSDPTIESATDQLLTSGVDRIIGLVLAPHTAAVSVGEYTRRAVEATAGRTGVDVIPSWYLDPGLIRMWSRRLAVTLTNLDWSGRAHVLFTAHSIPSMQQGDTDSYRQQVEETARAVASATSIESWSVAWQSAGRSGGQWLTPDLLKTIVDIGARSPTPALGGRPEPQRRGIVICPVGFVSDHLEVLYDLDIEARSVARKAGLEFARAPSINDDPELALTLADLVFEHPRRSAKPLPSADTIVTPQQS